MTFQDVIDFRQARRDLFAREDKALGERLEKAQKYYRQYQKCLRSGTDDEIQDALFLVATTLESCIVPCQELYGEGGWYVARDLAETWGIEL
jgi:hypothetical protein